MGWWIVLLIAIAVLFIAVHAVILPAIFLKNDYAYSQFTDRGSRTVYEENGKSIVYEPDIRARKRIKKYILSERKGKKYLICRLDDNTGYIDYDVALFDDEQKCFKVLNFKEIIITRGYTQTVELPVETSFVTVILNAADNEKFKKTAKNKVIKKSVVLYLLFGAIADAVCVISVKACLANLAGGIFGESFLASGAGWGITFAVFALTVALNVAFTLIYVRFGGGKNSEGRNV